MALEFLYFIDPNTLILSLLFVLIFALINFATSKTFKNNKGVSAIIAFCISAIAIYGIFKMNWDFENFYYSLGLTRDLLYTAVPILIILTIVLLSKKFGFGKILLIIGIILAVLSFTNIVFEKGIVFSIGAGLILLGIFFMYRSKKKDKISSGYMNSNKYYNNLGRQQNKNYIRQKRLDDRQSRKQKGYENQKRKQENIDEKYQKEQFLERKKQEKRDLEIQRQQEREQKLREKQAEQERIESEKQRRKEKMKRKNEEYVQTKKDELAKQYAERELKKRQNGRNQEIISRLEQEYYKKENEYNRLMQMAMQGDMNSPKNLQARRKAQRIANEITAIVDKINQLAKK